MRRLHAVIAAALLMPVCAEGADYVLRSEYRRDALDAEEEAKDFYRTQFRVFAGPETSAGAALSWQKETGQFLWTWNAVYDDLRSPVSVIIGNYYAQCGSGLLYGRLRPWNPDPFSAGAELSDAHGFTPCSSANPAYAFNGAACTVYPSGRDGIFAFRAGASRVLRYTEEDSDHPSSTHGSISTLLSRVEKKYPYTEALWCDTLTGSFLLHAGDYFTAECSALSLSCSNAEGMKKSWARYETGGRWSALKSVHGAAAYAAYNDGALRIFAESACTAGRLAGQGAETFSSKGFSAQGEIAFTSKLFTGSVKGKSIGENYASPFFSTYGSRSPSRGIFLAMKLSPSRSLTLSAESSADKKISVSQYSTEPSAAYRESASVRYKPVHNVTMEFSHAQTGSSYKNFPEKSRMKGEGIIKCKNVLFSAAASQQKSSSRTAFTASSGLQCMLFSRHRLSASAEYLRTEKANPVYSSALSEGGIPLFTAVSQTQVYAGSYIYYGNAVSLKTKYAQQCAGKQTLMRRWELSGEGTW